MTKRLRYLVGIALFLFILSIFMKGYSYNSNYECVGTLSYKETVLNKQQKVFVRFNIFPFTIGVNKGSGSINWKLEDSESYKSAIIGGVEFGSTGISMYKSFENKSLIKGFKWYMGQLDKNGYVRFEFQNYKFKGSCKKAQ